MSTLKTDDSSVQPKRTCPLDVAFTAASGKAVPLICGSWNCPSCARVNAREWARIAKFGVENLPGKCYFWTLTLPGYYKDTDYAYLKLPKLWDALRKDVQRHFAVWLYIAFVEGQPERSYMPHFHILSSEKSWKRFKDFAVSHGFGYQADQQEITGDGAASYVAKYASKQGNSAPKGFRRVRCSRSWPKPPKPPMQAYLVRSNSETLYGFLDRVAYTTHQDIGRLYEDYTLIMAQSVDTVQWSLYNKISTLDD